MEKLAVVKENLTALLVLKLVGRQGSQKAFELSENLKAALSKAPANLVEAAFEQLTDTYELTTRAYWNDDGLNLVILDEGDFEILRIVLG